MNRLAEVQATAAVVAAVGCVLSWVSAASTVDVSPVLPGEPVTTEVIYSAPMLALALLLATVAGMLAVFAIAGFLRRRSAA